jgi:phytoene dehydrogenase-like protein
MARNGRPPDRYDAIVFGSGAGGLTCATTLAQFGLRTMLAEKNPWYGGYAHGFGKDGFYWDHGGHIFLAYRLGGQAREVFQRLRLDERVEMVPDQHDYRCIFPDESMELPAEVSTAADLMAKRFPEERAGIEAVFLAMERMIDEVDLLVPSFRVQGRPGERKWIDPVLEQFQRPRFGDAAAPFARAFNAPGKTLLKYQNRTFKDLLDEHLHDPLLKAYFSMLCVGIATAPAELSAVIAGVFFVHSLRTMWMPRGGFGKLAETLAELFQEAGGTLETNAEVAHVVVDGDRAVGIETADGRRFTADAVVCACDAKRLYTELLPAQAVPARERERIAAMKTTPAFFQVQLGIDMDLEPYRERIKRLNFIYPYPDIDRAMANFPNGNVEEAAYYLYVATFHQPEMAPPGMHSMKLECPTRLDSKGIDWDRDKEQIADTFVRRTEAIIPDLSKHVVVREIRTPLDLARDTGNSEGAFAGWAFTPELLTRARPKQRGPVRGLYTCGHWSTPTAGVPWVMLSGYNTAGMVYADLKARGRKLVRTPTEAQPAQAPVT